MKKILCFTFAFILSMTFIYGQSKTCDCKTDLEDIVKRMKKMPSYKKQIKGENAIKFQETYVRLASKMKTPVLIEDCYKMLLAQMNMINDVHATLQYTHPYIANDSVSIEASIERFKASDLFLNHPKSDRPISKLKKELERKDLRDLEGIYNTNTNERVGIYYFNESKDLVGVVLESDLKHWAPGDIRFYATHTDENKYNLYYYDANSRQPGYVKSLSFENGRLWFYKKDGNTNNFELVDAGDKIVDFRQLSEDTQYLYFKTFGNNRKKELIAFYEQTKNKLTAENIIVDLRGNSGGNKKYSDPFLKLLKDKNVYVITNCFAGSNGEQFTLKLLKNKNALHLGQTTRGIIAYGKNYGYYYPTPSGHFTLTPTDMNFHQYIAYEGKGIKPEIKLDFDRDWIVQTLEIIESRTK